MLIPQLKAHGTATLSPSFFPHLLFWLLVISFFPGHAWVKTQPWPVMYGCQGAEGVLRVRDISIVLEPLLHPQHTLLLRFSFQAYANSIPEQQGLKTPQLFSQRRMRSALLQSGRLSVCFYWQFKDLSSFNIKCHSLFKVYFCVFIFPFNTINISSLFLKPMNNLHVITLYLRNGEIL